MTYYTLAKYFGDPSYKSDPQKLDDYFFDYIYLKRGNVDEVSRKSDYQKN